KAAGKEMLSLPMELRSNYGVRARFRDEGSKAAGNHALVIRFLWEGSEWADSSSYHFRISGNILIAQRKEGDQFPVIARSTLPSPSERKESLMEFGAVGSRLVGRYNEALVFVAEDATYPVGPAYIPVEGTAIRDIEVIN